MKNKKNVIAGFVVAVSLLWVARQIAVKCIFQAKNNAVEICIDYNQARSLCEKEGYQLGNFLQRAKAIGVSSVIVDEENMQSLENNGNIIYLSYNEIQELVLFELITPQSAVNSETIIMKDKKYAKYLLKVIEEKTRLKLNSRQEGQYTIIKIEDRQFLKQIGLGFDETKTRTLDGYGLDCILRMSKDNISWLPSELPENLSAIIFAKIPREKITDERNGFNFKLPYFEFEQYDSKDIALLQKSYTRVVKAHRIDRNYLKKASLNMLEQRWMRAVNERNCRLLYFDFIDDLDLETNLNYLRELSNKLKKNYILRTVNLNKVPLDKLNHVPGAVSKILSLLIAVIVPPLSVKYIWGISRHVSKATGPGNLRVLGDYLKISGITFFAAFIVTALMSDYRFIMRLDEFMGIKLSLVAPFVIIVGLMFKAEEIRKFTERNITIQEFLLFFVLVSAVVIMVIRSDYQILSAPLIESKTRTLLEQIFVYRPRFKEFLIGHPLLISGLWARNRMLVVLGVIGQVSLMNTFIHAQTPLGVSVTRTFYGLALGALVGFLGIYIYSKFIVIAQKYIKG